MFYVIAILVISYFIATSNPPPAQQNVGVSEVGGIPTAEEGKEIPVLFGTRFIKTANVVWSGNVTTNAIKSEAGGKK